MSRVDQVFALSAGAPSLARAWEWPAAVVLMAAAFIFLRPSVVGVDDVSWLITASERLLDGQRLYIDILELRRPRRQHGRANIAATPLSQVFGQLPANDKICAPRPTCSCAQRR